MNTKRFTLVILVCVSLTLIGSYASVSADDGKQPPTENSILKVDGCAAMNNPLHDYSYMVYTGLWGYFEAGDLLIINAREDVNDPPKDPVSVMLWINDVVVDSTTVPGKLTYSFRASTYVKVSWGTFEPVLIDWDVVCKRK